jgi:hypothetical protein
MSVLDESVSRVLEVDGTRSAAIIDAGTGMIVCSVGEVSSGLPEAAVGIADEFRAASLAGSEPDAGELQEIATMSDRWCHLVEVLHSRSGEGLLLFVEVDRTVTNVALAGLQVRKLVPGLLA